MAQKGLRRALAVLVLGLGLARTGTASVPGEKGKLFLEAFTPDDYDAHPQNWNVVQDGRGVVYVANLEGVLEYDGARWRRVPHAGKLAAWSLARGAAGRIYVGTSGDLGYLEADERGNWRFVSLLDRLDEEVPDLGAVRQILATPDDVFFRESRHLFRFHGDDLEVVADSEDPVFDRLAEVDGRVLAAWRGLGLVSLAPRPGAPLPGTEELGATEVTAVLGLDESRFLVATQRDGLFLHHGTAVHSWDTPAGRFAVEHLALGVTRLTDGRFALSTRLGGVAIFDAGGAIHRIADKGSGLPDNAVRGPGYEDAHGHLWLPLDRGLARLEVASPLEYFDAELGVNGLVLDIVRHRGELYLGTTQGVFLLQPSRDGTLARFTAVPGLRGGCGGLLSLGGELFAATSLGVFEVRDGRVVAEPLLDVAAWSLLPSASGDRLYAGTNDQGLHVFSRRGGRWVHEGRVSQTTGSIRTLVEDPAGRIWLRKFTLRRTEQVERVDPWGEDVDSWPLTVFSRSRGLPSTSDVVPFVWQGEVFVSEPTGIYRFEEEAERFERDADLGVLRASGRNNNAVVGAPRVDARGRLFFDMGTYDARMVERRGGELAVKLLFSRARVREFLVFHPEDDGSAVWGGGLDGRVIRYETSRDRPRESFVPVIRRVALPRSVPESPQFYGGHEPPDWQMPGLAYGSASLRFEYALPHYGASNAIEYQTRLVGLDEEWETPSTETYRDFTDLRDGHYRFEVRARDVRGRWISGESLTFRVLPPWYRTAWALMGYGLLAVLALLVFSRVHRRKLERARRLNVRLERQVEEQTQQLKVLTGLLPICASCKKIRDEDQWIQIETYIDERANVSFSHCICPECARTLYGAFDD